MDSIWAPWRMSYIQNPDRVSGCVFCKEVTQKDGTDNLIVHRGTRAFIILNRYPYTSGHLMVVPFAHEGTLEALGVETRVEIMELSTRALSVLTAEYHPQGFNLGINIGEIAGAGISEHIHLHIVPRWGGDTNFMSTVGTARVLPETLEETYRRIAQRWSSP